MRLSLSLTSVCSVMSGEVNNHECKCMDRVQCVNNTMQVLCGG